MNKYQVVKGGPRCFYVQETATQELKAEVKTRKSAQALVDERNGRA